MFGNTIYDKKQWCAMTHRIVKINVILYHRENRGKAL